MRRALVFIHITAPAGVLRVQSTNASPERAGDRPQQCSGCGCGKSPPSAWAQIFVLKVPPTAKASTTSRTCLRAAIAWNLRRPASRSSSSWTWYLHVQDALATDCRAGCGRSACQFGVRGDRFQPVLPTLSSVELGFLFDVAQPRHQSLTASIEKGKSMHHNSTRHTQQAAEHHEHAAHKTAERQSIANAE